MSNRRPIASFERKVRWLLDHIDVWHNRLLSDADWKVMIDSMKDAGLIARTTNASDTQLREPRAEAIRRYMRYIRIRKVRP